MNIREAVSAYIDGVRKRQEHADKSRRQLDLFWEYLRPLQEAGAPLLSRIEGDILIVEVCGDQEWRIHKGSDGYVARRGYDTRYTSMPPERFLDLIVPRLISGAKIT